MRRRKSVAFTLTELLVVIVLIAVLIAILLPMLKKAREAAIHSKIASQQADWSPSADASKRPGPDQPIDATTAPKSPDVLAAISAFDATIDLTPKLSVGTAQPESIYRAAFAAKLIAKSAGSEPGARMLQLPLPPQIISLGDVKFTINDASTTDITLEGDKLVWRGVLPAGEVPIDVTYTAIGRGVYSFQTPPGKIIDQFKVALTANGSDVRMLDLSLQPTKVSRASSSTTYTWDYQNLMFGRPIAVDVLGIAPIDRLGELTWLGPISVVVLGIVLGLMSRAFDHANIDRWMLMLVLATFTAAYPLMYFAQQFVPLWYAMAASVGIVLTVIAMRLLTTIGFPLTLFGVIVPAGVIFALTLAATIYPDLQGILLTIMGLGLVSVGMALTPRIAARAGATSIPSTGPIPG
jgi:hypothetical protein